MSESQAGQPGAFPGHYARADVAPDRRVAVFCSFWRADSVCIANHGRARAVQCLPGMMNENDRAEAVSAPHKAFEVLAAARALVVKAAKQVVAGATPEALKNLAEMVKAEEWATAEFRRIAGRRTA